MITPRLSPRASRVCFCDVQEQGRQVVFVGRSHVFGGVERQNQRAAGKGCDGALLRLNFWKCVVVDVVGGESCAEKGSCSQKEIVAIGA